MAYLAPKLPPNGFSLKTAHEQLVLGQKQLAQRCVFHLRKSQLGNQSLDKQSAQRFVFQSCVRSRKTTMVLGSCASIKCSPPKQNRPRKLIFRSVFSFLSFNKLHIILYI